MTASGAQTSSVDLIAVLVTFNRPRELNNHLLALGESNLKPRKVYIVDNGSPRSSVVAEVPGVSLEYIFPQTNLGPAGGLDLGISRALDEDPVWTWALLLDDDDPPRTAAVIGQLAALAGRSDDNVGGIGVAGAKFRWAGISMRSTLRYAEASPKADTLFGGYLPMYRRAALEPSSPFDARLFFGFEELGAGLELKRRGYQLVTSNEIARSNGYSSDRSESRERSEQRDYYSTRNYLFLMARYRWWIAPAVFIRQALGLLRPIGRMTRRRAARIRLLAWRAAARRSLGRNLDLEAP